jgi:hypothetical protein
VQRQLYFVDRLPERLPAWVSHRLHILSLTASYRLSRHLPIRIRKKFL